MQKIDREEKVSSTWRIPNDMQGLRVDTYLKRRIGRISRNRAQRIIAVEDLLIDEQAVKPSYRVKAGQLVRLKRFAPDEVTAIDDFDVGIIYEDDELLIVNKPAGLNIHPTANSLYRTLTFFLRKNYPLQKLNPCHRLDKETSGLVVVAKTRRMESQIKKAFMQGHVEKTYVAIVSGIVNGSHTIDLPLGLQRDRGIVAIRMIRDPNGKEAITKIRPLWKDYDNDRTVVVCRPLTGRQHQIRAHLSLFGHPIIADKLYGMGDEFFDRYTRGEDTAMLLPHWRHALHAARLRFTVDKRKFVFKSPWPEDFLDLVRNSNAETRAFFS